MRVSRAVFLVCLCPGSFAEEPGAEGACAAEDAAANPASGIAMLQRMMVEDSDSEPWPAALHEVVLDAEREMVEAEVEQPWKRKKPGDKEDGDDDEDDDDDDDDGDGGKRPGKKPGNVGMPPGKRPGKGPGKRPGKRPGKKLDCAKIPKQKLQWISGYLNKTVTRLESMITGCKKKKMEALGSLNKTLAYFKKCLPKYGLFVEDGVFEGAQETEERDVVDLSGTEAEEQKPRPKPRLPSCDKLNTDQVERIIKFIKMKMFYTYMGIKKCGEYFGDKLNATKKKLAAIKNCTA